MKYFITVLNIFIVGSTLGQIDHELRFDCLSHDETKCNPFATSSPFCPDQGIYKNNWRVSHGSPQLRAFNSNNPTRVAVLKAVNTNGVSPKGEGMFLGYNFQANRSYTIEFILRIEDPNLFTTISMTSKAANGLVAKTNGTICSEETLPTENDTQTILSQASLPFKSGNELGLITVSNFVPTKNFSYFWIYADPEGFGNPTSEFVVSHITITDVTSSILNNTICCNQNFTTNSANPSLLTGSIPTGGNSSYSYQWQQRTTNTWTNISGATNQNYDPPTISQATSYKRIVISGSETSESNIVDINLEYDNTCLFKGSSESIGPPDLYSENFKTSSNYSVLQGSATIACERVELRDSDPSSPYASIYVNFDFQKNSPIVLSYFVDFLTIFGNSLNVKFIATNGDDFSTPGNIDWSESELISEISDGYLDQTQGSLRRIAHYYRYANYFNPSKDYHFLWILATDLDGEIFGPGIENISIYSPGKFNLNRLDQRYGGADKNITITSDYLSNDQHPKATGSISTLGSVVVNSGLTVSFTSKTVVMNSGFHAKNGANFSATAKITLVSDDPFNPSGPLIDANSTVGRISYALENPVDSSQIKNIYTTTRTGSEIYYGKYVLEKPLIPLHDQDRIVVYPNPNNGDLTLSFSSGINASNGMIIIYNQKGIERYSETINGSIDIININLSFLSPGNYYLKYIGKQHVITKQIVIE